MAGDIHAREPKKGGSRQKPVYKAQACEGLTFYEFSYTQAQKHRRAIRRTEHTHSDPEQQTAEEESEPMALSEEARQWMIENGLEGLLRIADAPPHAEPEQAAASIDLSEVTEGAVQALTGIKAGGLQTIENPSSQILFEYFGEYSISSKAYRTQGGENLLFGEVARAMMEYGFVNSRPPAIAKYRAAFVIATYEGLQVDWLHFITEGLKEAIKNLVEGKKPWAGIAQWLTVLVPPVLPIKQKKRGRQETTPKKTAKRRQILEKHTPGWTQEEDEQREAGPSRQQQEPATKAKPARKGKEKTTKKTTKEPAEEEPVAHKPIKITLRRQGPDPEPEPEDFIQKVRMVAAPGEEAETEEDSSEPLVRQPPRQGKEKRAKGPAPPVGGTQQRVKGPPPVAGAEAKQDEGRTAQKTAVPEPAVPDFREPVIPEKRNEQVSEQEKRPEKHPELRSGNEQGFTDQGSTKPQWLRWLSEQVSGVADQMEEEEERREHLTRTTTQELVVLRAQLHELQGELLQANERIQQAQVVTEPVGTSRTQAEPEPKEALQTGPETEKLIATLREELKAQEALRENEREQRKLVEDDRRRMEEGLRRGKATNDRLQEEKEKLQKEKDRLRRQVEQEIERLQEELRQQKDRDDRLRAQVNRRLKQKTEDFDRLYRDYKQAESDSKKRAADSDRQIEKLKEQLKETRLDLAKAMDEVSAKKEALSAEKTLASEQRKELEALRREKLEIIKSRNEEKERSTFVLNKLQSTYEKQRAEYEAQAQVSAAIIIRARKEKQEAYAHAKAGVDRIKLIMSGWSTRAQASINESTEKLWKEWSQQAAELQTLRADAENRKKTGDKFYKMDEESIVTIREELSEDFYALAEEHLKEIRGLVEKLDDGQLATQLELERYEQDRLRQEAEGKTTPITISEGERPAEAEPTDNEPRQGVPEEELPVQEEQVQTDAGEEEELRQENTGSEEKAAPNRPVETGESDTGNRTEPGTEEEQDEPGRSGEEAPVQAEPEQQIFAEQPIQPEVGGEAGKGESEEEAPLDTFERSLLDILEED